MTTNLPEVEVKSDNRRVYFGYYESSPCIFMESIFYPYPKDKQVLRFLSDQHLEIINCWEEKQIEEELKNELNLTFRRRNYDKTC